MFILSSSWLLSVDRFLRHFSLFYNIFFIFVLVTCVDCLTITVNFLTHVKVSYPICQCTEI